MPIEIKSTKDIALTRFTCVVYGQPGIGKTSLAKTLPSKPLIVSAESGLLSLGGTDFDVIEISKWVELPDVIHFLEEPATKEKYKWIFIDSLTELGEKLVEILKPKYPDPKNVLKMWGEYSDRMTLMIKKFRDFAPYNVVFTALEKNTEDALKRRYTEIDLNGRVAKKVPAMFDEVFHMDQIETEGQGAIRVLYTVPHDNAKAKDRSGKLPTPYMEPHLGKVWKLITGGQE